MSIFFPGYWAENILTSARQVWQANLSRYYQWQSSNNFVIIVYLRLIDKVALEMFTPKKKISLHCHVFMHPDNWTSSSSVVTNQYLYQWRLSNLIRTIQPDNLHLPLEYKLGKANDLHGPVFYVLFANWERRVGRFIHVWINLTAVATWNQGKDGKRI